MEYKVFRVTADYRKDNPNKPTYLVAAINKRECRKRFNNHFSWLDIYKIELAEDEELNPNVLFYRLVEEDT